MAQERILQVRLILKSLESIRNLSIDSECMLGRMRARVDRTRSKVPYGKTAVGSAG